MSAAVLVYDECKGCETELPCTELHYDLAGRPWCQNCEPTPQLVRCYVCHLEQTGKPATTDDEGPIRTVVSTGLVAQRFDPTVSYRLDCGHTVI